MNRFRGVASWVLAGLALALVLVAGAPALVGPAGAAKTKTTTFDPWSGANIKASVHIGSTVKGTCWTTSIAVSKSYAYRCMADNEIYDPCFAPSIGRVSTLLCFTGPWSTGVRLELSAALPKAALHKSSAGLPWAFTLSNARRCVINTGTGAEIDHVVLYYYCVPGKGLASTPQEHAQHWRSRYATSYGAKTLQTQDVEKIWN